MRSSEKLPRIVANFIASVVILYFKEPMTAIKLVLLGFIVAGVVGLNLAGEVH